jgi:signal transduction histidine kinase
VEYLALPLRVEGETAGVFVATIFAERAEADVDSVVRAVGAVGVSLLLLGSLLAWRLADRLVQPVTALTRTARSISETDFDSRIPVRGRDEVAELAVTFNEMLDRLEHAFSSQRRFLDDAGHELKTPLTIVRGHLELLDLHPHQRPETIALVLDELDRMARIVDDLLLLAKHERPDFLALAPVDVTTLTYEVFAKAQALAPRRWVLEECGAGTVVADRHRLTQAMTQLAENAVRYADVHKTIGIGSRVTADHARFWVRDGGPGVPPGERGMIFERFHRGELRGAEGAGLGLAIVKAIAEAHGGQVTVETPSGGGTQFSLDLPLDRTTTVEGSSE